MIEEIKVINGFKIVIEYNTGYDESTPPSKRYKLSISEGEKVRINRYGLTLGGAKNYYKKWIDKKINQLGSILY